MLDLPGEYTTQRQNPMDKITAIIVAKKNSVRLKNKNMLPYGNSTVLGHKIQQLINSSYINEVVVGSNCEYILKYSEDNGAVPIFREEEYCDEKICPANLMIYDMVHKIKPTDTVLWAHCTNPNIQTRTYNNAIVKYREQIELGYDSLVSVDETKNHFWEVNENKQPKPMNFNPWGKSHPLASTLKPYYQQNGAIFIQPYENMLSNSYFYGLLPYLFVTPILESHDINNELDFKICKSIHEEYFNNEK